MTTTTTITITGYSTSGYNADASNTDYVFDASALRKASSGYGISLAASGDILTNFGYVSGFGGITVGANDTVVNALEIIGKSNPAGHPNYGILLGTNSAVTNLATGVIMGNQAIVTSGADVVTNYGALEGYGIGVVLGGGTVINRSGGVVQGEFQGIDMVEGGGGTVINAGTITGFTGSAIYFQGGGNRLVVYSTGVFNGLVDGGSNATLELHSSSSAGTIADFGVSFTNFGTVQFDPGSDWSVSGTGADLSGTRFSGFGDGDTIDLTGFTASSISTLSGNTGLVLFGASSDVLLNFTTSISSFGFTTGPSGTDVTMCFLPGTLIRTPHGEVKVEELVAGDTVCTLCHRGGRPITWIGKGKVLATRGRRGPATPVVIRKGAFADNVPYADLRVTKAHGFYFDDALIPVEFLVNHRTIAWDDEAKEVTLYHIELDAHDVLFANGAPAESFRDDGNRWLFHNAHEITQSALQQSCLPVLTGGAIVDAAWQRLLDRAGTRPSSPTTDDPDVHLLIDGVRLDADRRLGAMLVFHLHRRPGNLRIVSRHAVPSELGLSRDPRSLGVAIRQVVLTRGPRMAIVDADDDRLTQGFHDYEPDEGIRWTSGDATLPQEAFAGFAENTMLELHLGGATTYRLLPEAAAA